MARVPHLLHLLHDLLLLLVFGDGADEEAAVVQTHADADELPGSDLTVVQHLDGPLSRFSGPEPTASFTNLLSSPGGTDAVTERHLLVYMTKA